MKASSVDLVMGFKVPIGSVSRLIGCEPDGGFVCVTGGIWILTVKFGEDFVWSNELIDPGGFKCVERVFTRGMWPIDMGGGFIEKYGPRC